MDPEILTVNNKLFLQFGGCDPILEGYTDSDMAGCLDGKKSTLD